MKKNLIFMLSLLMTLTTAFVFSSCEKDENGKEEVISDPAQWGKALVGKWTANGTSHGNEGTHPTETTFTYNLILNADGTGSVDNKKTIIYKDDNSSHDYSGKYSFTWTYEVDDRDIINPGTITVVVTSSEEEGANVGDKFYVSVYSVTKNSVQFGDTHFGYSSYNRK